MVTLIDAVRQVIGIPNFYVNGALDYGAVLEYFVCSLILVIVITSVFRIFIKIFS